MITSSVGGEQPAEAGLRSSLFGCAGQVAAFVVVLDKDLADRKKTAEVDLGPLLTLSYSGLSAAELGRRLKHVPVAFYAQKPPELFDLMCTDTRLGGAE